MRVLEATPDLNLPTKSLLGSKRWDEYNESGNALFYLINLRSIAVTIGMGSDDFDCDLVLRMLGGTKNMVILADEPECPWSLAVKSLYRRPRIHHH